ncbi:MAG: flavin reductase family protein [Gammaproteobacteria bacterium]|nr:flavin reductase family protein [Gammaproteobacteria bacterium]
MASSVCVVTSLDRAGNPHAITATSVSSLSLEPAALLVSVNRLAAVHAAIIESNAFCINILNNKQKLISEQCSRRELEEGYLSQTPWRRDKSGIPYLPEGLACVFCALDRAIEYSTHSIFIGQVQRTQLHGEIAPLIYFDGQYFTHGSTLMD